MRRPRDNLSYRYYELIQIDSLTVKDGERAQMGSKRLEQGKVETSGDDGMVHDENIDTVRIRYRDEVLDQFGAGGTRSQSDVEYFDHWRGIGASHERCFFGGHRE